MHRCRRLTRDCLTRQEDSSSFAQPWIIARIKVAQKVVWSGQITSINNTCLTSQVWSPQMRANCTLNIHPVALSGQLCAQVQRQTRRLSGLSRAVEKPTLGSTRRWAYRRAQSTNWPGIQQYAPKYAARSQNGHADASPRCSFLQASSISGRMMTKH